MQSLSTYRKYIVTSICGVVMAFSVSFQASAADKLAPAALDALFSTLADPNSKDWAAAERKIEADWSNSGSPALNFLLQRGRDAMAAGDLPAAIEHLTALTDQAPDFAEGWNARATAYYLAGLYGPSISDIQHVLRLEPRHFGAIAGLGLILGETGKKATAMAAFRRSLALNPHQEGIRKALDALEKAAGGTSL
jgi:tetratricopeptide (TPR) repeat protein